MNYIYSIIVRFFNDYGNKLSKNVVDLISILYIILWVYASTNKLIDVQRFHDQLAQSAMLNPYAKLIVVAIPSIEYFLSLLLLSDRFRLFALYSSFGLMTVFSSYIIFITRLSDFIPCSCGGIMERLSWNQHLLLNITFLILAVIAIFLFPQKGMENKRFFCAKKQDKLKTCRK